MRLVAADMRSIGSARELFLTVMSEMPWKRTELSPEVLQRLEVVAREVREFLWDGEGVPELGTLFSEIEAQGMTVGGELARLIMQQSVDGQAQVSPPAEMLEFETEPAVVVTTRTTELETPAGPVE